MSGNKPKKTSKPRPAFTNAPPMAIPSGGPGMSMRMGGPSGYMDLQQRHILSPKLSSKKVTPRYAGLARLKRRNVPRSNQHHP